MEPACWMWMGCFSFNSEQESRHWFTELAKISIKHTSETTDPYHKYSLKLQKLTWFKKI